ncbi:MAG: preprotein translocase subunit YajC [Planctomycetota bacterium]
MMLPELILAQAGQGGGDIVWGMLLPFGAIFVIMYFMLIRPQQKKEKERQEMLSRIKKNERVITTGGIHGVVTNFTDADVTIRVDDEANVKIRFSRGAIARVVEEEKK